MAIDPLLREFLIACEAWTARLTHATALQLLDFNTKLLGVEQGVVARQLGVSHTAVSLWMTRKRPVPVKYRPALVEWSQVALRHAMVRWQKEVERQPTDDLKRATVEAASAPLMFWTLEVDHYVGTLEQIIQRNLETLSSYVGKAPLMPQDLRDIQAYCQVLLDQTTVVLSLAKADDAGEHTQEY